MRRRNIIVLLVFAAVLFIVYMANWHESSSEPEDQGKTLEVWKKQADGTWKCVADMWSSDLPATPQ